MVRPIGIVIALTITAYSAGAFASDACYPQSQADAYARDFNFGAGTFEGGADLCGGDSELVALFRTLDFLRLTEIRPQLKPPFVTGILSNDYYGYLKSRIRILNGPLRRCPTGADSVACAGGLGELILGESFFSLRVPFRASAIVHEVHHLDGNFPHVRCEAGNEKGQARSCDETFAERGAYAAQLEYLARLFLLAPGVTLSDRIAIKGFALYLAQNKFNHADELDGRRAAVLADQRDGSVVLFDGQRASALETRLNQGSRLLARDRNFVVLPGDRSRPSYLLDPYLDRVDLAKATDVMTDPEAMGRAIIDFNKRWPLTVREGLLDSMRFGSAGKQALLFSDRIEIVSPGSATPEVFSSMGLSRFLMDVPCGDSLPDSNALYGLDHEAIRKISLSAPNIFETRSAEKLSCQWPTGDLDYVRLDSLDIALGSDGMIFKVSRSGQRDALPNFTDRRFRQVTRFKELFFWGLMPEPNH